MIIRIGYIVAMLSTVAVFLVSLNTNRANAFVNLNPDPGGALPANLRNYLQNCDTYGSSPAFVQWIGSQIGPQEVAVVNVPYGQQFVDVRWYIAGTVCYSNSAVLTSRYHLVGASPGASWWSSATLNFQNCGYNSVGCFQAAAIDVRYTNSVPFTETGFIGVDLYASGINQFTTGLFGCVGGPGGNKGSLDNYSGCFFTNPTFYISIIVDPPIRGCTDPAAENFNRDAREDDGSCRYPGCTDPTAQNHNPRANRDNGTCQYAPTVTIRAQCFTQSSFTSARLEIIVNASDRNGNIASVSGTVAGQNFGNGTTNLNVPYNTSGTASVTVTDTTGYSASATSNVYSCPRPPIPGCTDPAAANFNPAAELDDGTCIYDFCLNIAGIQSSTPSGLTRDGPNCIFPTPVCTPGPDIDVLTGVSFSPSINVRNTASVTLDLRSIDYAGPSGISGQANGGDPDIGASGNRDFSFTSTRNDPANGTITWTIRYGQTSLLPDASITCSQTISVRNRPPTCTVIGISIGGVPRTTIEVRENFRAHVRVNNPNPGNLSIVIANYQIQNGTSGGDNLNGSVDTGLPRSISPGDTEMQSAENIRVGTQSLNFNVQWTIDASDTDAVTCALPIDNTVLPDAPLIPPICETSTLDVVVGLPFTMSVSVINRNRFAPIQLRDRPSEFTLSNGFSGNATPTGGWDGSEKTLGAGTSTSIAFISESITVGGAGDYTTNWSIDSEAGPATGDCVDVGAPPGSGGPDDPTVSAYTRPYVRFYGNDVFAGGEYGATCSVSGNAQATAYGFFSANTQSRGVYSGAASELAVFAVGQIDSILPGSQDLTRPSLGSLSFANTSLGTGTYPFGGQFSSTMCADDYWALRPTGMDDIPAAAVTNDGTGLQTINLSLLPSGNYYYDGQVTVIASAPIADGVRISLYVNGNTWIGNSTYTLAAARSITYEVSDNWTNVTQIPLVRMVTLGNIYVDNNINQLDGMYVAMPNPAVTEPTGEIHTCALSESLTDLANPTTSLAIADNCGTHNLTVYGAFVAKRVQLLRIGGNMGTAPAPPELATSGNIAEVFRFSPELYLALIGQGYAAAPGDIDSLLTLPPSL